jgi:hypothetical protein
MVKNQLAIGRFEVSGAIVPSRSGRSFKVYQIGNGNRVFIGLVPRVELYRLLRDEIAYADISRFINSKNPRAVAQEQLSIKIVDPSRLGVPKP